MDLGISNKTFLITGSSRGIGRSIAHSFLEEGAKVLMVARGEKKLTETSVYFQNKFGKKNVSAWTFDLTKETNVNTLKKKVVEHCGELDGLIANVGDGKSLPDPITSSKHWQSIWSKNFETALFTSRAFLPILRKNGVIIFISSICGVEALGGPVDYSVAKAALLSFSKNLARKVAPDVRVNVVAPGNIFVNNGTWDLKQKENSRKKSHKINLQRQRKKNQPQHK